MSNVTTWREFWERPSRFMLGPASGDPRATRRARHFLLIPSPKSVVLALRLRRSECRCGYRCALRQVHPLHSAKTIIEALCNVTPADPKIAIMSADAVRSIRRDSLTLSS